MKLFDLLTNLEFAGLTGMYIHEWHPDTCRSIDAIKDLYDTDRGIWWSSEYRFRNGYIFQIITAYIKTPLIPSPYSAIKTFKHGPHKIVRRWARLRK